MNLRLLREKLFKNRWPTPLGWVVLVGLIALYLILKHGAQGRRAASALSREVSPLNPTLATRAEPRRAIEPVRLPEVDLPPPPAPAPAPSQPPPTPGRQYSQPSFGNLSTSGKILSDDFLPKGTILYATLTSDIVSNNQVSPAIATVIHPAIFAHRLRVPVGTQVTGRIAPGNLRGRVFVTWDTLIFTEEGRQGWELPIKGIGMTYEENPHSGRWTINGAGLKGYVFDDSTANTFKLAALKAMQDFAKTLQTYVTTQNSAVTSGSVVTTTTTTPEATLQNSGLGAASAFLDVLAARYAANLQQQNAYVLVPTARLCAIFLDEPVDLSTAAPGRSISQGPR